MVQCDVEDVEVAQAFPVPLRLKTIGWTIEQQGHFLLGHAAMRAQRYSQSRQVMLRAPGTEYRVASAHDHEVSHAIIRQLEALARSRVVEHDVHARQFSNTRRQRFCIDGTRQVDSRERTE